MCLCISVRKTNVKLYGIIFRSVCIEVSKRSECVCVYGFVKFAAYTYREFVLVVPCVPRHLTDFHEVK